MLSAGVQVLTSESLYGFCAWCQPPASACHCISFHACCMQTQSSGLQHVVWYVGVGSSAWGLLECCHQGSGLSAALLGYKRMKTLSQICLSRKGSVLVSFPEKSRIAQASSLPRARGWKRAFPLLMSSALLAHFSGVTAIQGCALEVPFNTNPGLVLSDLLRSCAVPEPASHGGI